MHTLNINVLHVGVRESLGQRLIVQCGVHFIKKWIATYLLDNVIQA